MQSKCGDKNTGGGTAEELGIASHNERDHSKRRREEQDDADLLLSMTRRSRRVTPQVAQQTRFVDDDSQARQFPLARLPSCDDDDEIEQETASTSIAAAAVAAAAAAAAMSGIGTTSDIRLHAPSVYTNALESLQRLIRLSASQNNPTLPSPFHFLSRQHVLPLIDTRPPLDYSLLSSSPILAALYHHSALAAPRPFLAGVDPRCIMPLSSPLDYNLANRFLFEGMQHATRLPDLDTHQLQQIARQRFLVSQGKKSEPKRTREANYSYQIATATSMQRIPDSSLPTLPSTKMTCRKTNKTMNPPSITGSLLYDVSSDHDKLNDHQIYLRMQIEYFQATQDDILSLTRGKNKPIVLQQVGIRCRHCCHVPVGQRKKGSTYFPSALMGIYQAAQNLSVEHLQSGMCPEVPLCITNQFATFASRRRPGVPGGGKKYWADSGAKLGLVDTDDGIRFSRDVSDG